MRFAVLMLLLAIAAFASADPSMASDGAWSFLDHPALSDSEVSVTYDDAIAIADSMGRDSCRVYEESAWADYLARYPAFAPYSDLPEMRIQWLQSALKVDFNSSCYLRNLERDLTIAPELLDAAGPIYFCGNLSREPRNRHEERAVEAWLTLLTLARPDSAQAIRTIVELRDWYGTVRLDRRLRHYYLTLQQMATSPVASRWTLTWFESRQLTSSKERERIEAAARRGDLAAVLAMLPPCKGEPEEGGQKEGEETW